MAGKKKGGARLADRAWDLLRTTLESGLAERQQASAAAPTFAASVPPEQREQVRAVLESDPTPTRAYRIALVIQLAYGIESDAPLDLTQRPPGARGVVAKRCGELLKKAHVVAPVNAYQNIGKNAVNLARGNFAAFDTVLRWASEPARTKEELRAIFEYACHCIARTARPIDPLPDVDQARLTFAAVLKLFDDMLNVGSGGAHEQFIVTSLLHAKVEQGGTRQRVETKNLTASDHSSGSAADVQVKTGTNVDEAFEVTANQWTEKITGAARTIRAHDLARLHILAGIENFQAMLSDLLGRPEDISVVDLRSFITVLTAELRKQFRASALRRLYELLDRYQPNPDLVNGYVRKLRDHGLTLGS